MARRDYLDFDLMIEANEDGTYSARVSASPAGEALNRFEFPYGPLELENFLLRLGHSRQVVRRIDSPHMEAARQFGSGLYRAAFDGEVGTAYRRSLDAVEREGKGLRLRLRLSGAPDLNGLPWEFLYDEGIGDFLVLSERRPLVRYPEIPRPVRPLDVRKPLHVLLVVSNPTDHDVLDVEREQQMLQSALSDLTDTGQLHVSVLERASLSALQRSLRRNDVHVLHYIGHGGFDTQTGEGVLLFEDEQGRGRRVGAASLGTILHDHDPLRLVVLNACEGARTGTEDPFAGVAPELARRGAPAVIAMQFEVTDSASITFSHEFYMAVADGYPLDAATAAARKAIFAEGNGLEWATPVLYLRAPDGVIFELSAPPREDVRDEHDQVETHSPIDEEAAREAALTETLARAELAARVGDWATAIRHYQDVLAANPDHVEASLGLAEVQRQIRVDELSDRARTAHDAGEHAEAIRLWDELATLAPGRVDEVLRQESVEALSQPTETDEQPEVTNDGDTPLPRPAWQLVGGLGAVAAVLVVVLGVILWPGESDEPNGTTPPTTPPETLTTPPVTVPVTDFVVAYLEEPPEIDGRNNDWPAGVTSYRTENAAEPKERVPDPDVDSDWRLGWDEEALYLFVAVRDSTPGSGDWEVTDLLYNGDGINFIFGSAPDDPARGMGIEDGDLMILIGPDIRELGEWGEGEEAIPALSKQVPVERRSGSPAVDCEVLIFEEDPEEDLTPFRAMVETRVVRTAQGYNVEAKVPWPVLIGEQIPEAGGVYGTILTVADGPRRTNGSRSTVDDRLTAKHCPEVWQTLVLLPAGSS